MIEGRVCMPGKLSNKWGLRNAGRTQGQVYFAMLVATSVSHCARFET